MAIVSALTGMTAADSTIEVESALDELPAGARADGWARLQGIVQQAPMRYDEREGLLSELARLSLDAHAGLGAAALDVVLRRPLAIPTLDRPVTLPPVVAELEGALRVVIELDRRVPAPWTLIGGLMVLLHCAEHGAPFTRPTSDADIVVSVFTHRDALAQLTGELSRLGFVDRSPSPMGGGPQRSYRWVSDLAKVDVAVPPKANDQIRVARSTGKRMGIELPATQQALRRTQRVPVALGEGTGWIRRPDLLGALVIKATAAVTDNRDADRHLEDLVVLADILALTGSHVTYATQMRPKDIKRLNQALARCAPRHWRKARDPLAAQGALEFILAPS